MMTNKNRKTISPQTLCQLLLNLKGILLTHPLLIQMRVKERNQTITIMTAAVVFIIFPVTIGSGKRLFGRGTIPAGFKLLKSKASPEGVIIPSYTRAGEIKTGSFA